MKYSYTNAQMRAADARTIAGGISAETLMERAGRALADTVLSAAKRLNIGDALVVCGGGNNGGDGFVAARLLEEAGLEVSLVCLAARFSPDCLRAKQAYGGEVIGRIPRRRYALIADCVFGTGLSRAPQGDDAALIEFINGCGAYVVSADLPSGLSENGVAFTPCVRANETVCMGLMKNALLLSDGADCAGKIAVADIGISSREAGAELWEKEDVKACFPQRKSNSHKGSYGSACILGGSMAYSGAAFLSAGACLKSGAGYTRLCVSSDLFPYAIGRLPACILREFRAIDGEILASDCIAAGMGSGADELVYARIAEILSAYTGTLVLDADALNALALFGADILKSKSCSVVVTPHIKEFARLTGKRVEEVRESAVELAKEYAKEYGVTVLLKNNRSVVTDGERVAINLSGSPALAKGGSGDVLAGFLAGTCARGVPPFEACCVSAYLCGKAGEAAAHDMGEYAPDASDIISYLPRVMAELQA